MKDLLASAESELLAPAGLGRGDVEAALGRLAGAGADYGEVFLQNRKGERWSLEDGRVKDGSFSVDLGVGVRAVAGEKTGAAYAEDIRRDGLDDAVAAACAIARGGGGDAQASALSRPRSRRMYDATSPISELSSQAKIDLLAQVDRAAREMDNRVEQVQATLGMSHEVMLVAATDGVLAADLRPLVRLDVSVIAVEGKRRERGSAGAGGRRSLTTFSHEWPADLAREAVRMALVNLDAVEAPAGPCRWCSVQVGRAYCCTKRWGMVWRATSTARAVPPFLVDWGNRWRLRLAPSWMMAPCRVGAARCRWTTKARRQARPF